MHQRMKIIMISGPYTGDGSTEVIAKNIELAEKFAVALSNRGIGFFCPHSNAAQFHLKGSRADNQFYVDLNLELQERATDAILMLPGWETSPGAKGEYELALVMAKEKEYPIFFPQDENDLTEIEKWYFQNT